jgi:glutamate 5-kinase
MRSMVDLARYSETSARVAAARRLVIKIGSALLLNEDGSVATDWIAALATDIAELRLAGVEICIVSSGAVGLGRAQLGLGDHLRLEEKQAAAAAGQSLLMEAWQAALSPYDLITAQILLTLTDTENRRRYLNARTTIGTLLSLGTIPVINENDTTATDEIRYGDNDRLAAHVTQMCGADTFVMLSDVDGLYESDPRHVPNAAHIPVVSSFTNDILAMASGPNAVRGSGSGGMKTKIEAAKIAVAAGCAAIIAKGDIDRPLSALKNGARATLFTPKATPDKARRAWIAGRLKPEGAIHIDDGAVAALKKGASLLPAGIASVEGEFEKGDAVAIYRPDGALVGQGLSAYDSREVKAIIGLQSADVENVLGYRRAAAVHRDDLAFEADL